MDASKRRCALYLRMSLDHTGEGLGIARQRDTCTEIAERRGWNIVGEYIDNSISASDARKKRPGYDRLVTDYEAGMFDAMVCYDLDRLTRQPRQLEDWIDRAESGELLLSTANGEADLTTDGGRTYARIKLAVARGEVERKSARQKSANRQRATRGRPPLGVRLTGYTSLGAVVPEEAEVVRRVFREFLAGESLKAIARGLERDGIRTRHGGAWNPSSIVTALKNPRYAGLAIYDGKLTGQKGDWEPLVSETTYAAVRAKLEDPRRKTNRLGTHRRHLGSGMFLCDCGKVVRGFSGPRYRCCYSRSMEAVDEYVEGVIRERLGRPDLRDLLAAKSSDHGVTDELHRLRQRLDQIGNDYDSGLIDARRYAVATEKVQSQIADAEKRLTRKLGSPGLSQVLASDNPAAAYSAAGLGVRRSVIAALMAVTLHPQPRGRRGFDPDSVTIEWRR